MDKKLANLNWKPRWVSHLGCIKGCLDLLCYDISWPWLYGGSGHAFVINIQQQLCPSGPTAWNYEMIFKLGTNLGFRVSSVFGSRDDSDFFQKRLKAWIHVCNCIDANIPCYGWELIHPEFYVINGIQDDNYIFDGPGCNSHNCAKPWFELGNTDIGIIEVMSIDTIDIADSKDVLCDALSFALRHASKPGKWALSGYYTGPKAFDVWADALEQGSANRTGNAYNAAVWAECRQEAAAFLSEAKLKINKAASAFDQAIKAYSEVADKLNDISRRFPIGTTDQSGTQNVKCAESAVILRQASVAEQQGLNALSLILDEIK